MHSTWYDQQKQAAAPSSPAPSAASDQAFGAKVHALPAAQGTAMYADSTDFSRTPKDVEGKGRESLMVWEGA